MDIRLETAEFKYFRGFIVPRIKHIKMSFDQALQMFLSSNGSGKSTSIEELSFFPIDKETYKTNGYKIITFTCNGRLYTFKSSHKTNSLIDDAGTELILGGTKTEALLIIKDLTGLTPEIWRMAIGLKKFIGCKDKERRRWIEIISKINFDFPLELYYETTIQVNTIKRMIKQVSTDLVTETAKILDADELEVMATRSTDIAKHISTLRDGHGVVVSNAVLTQQFKELTQLRTTLRDAILTTNTGTYFNNPIPEAMCRADFVSIENDCRTKLAVIETKQDVALAEEAKYSRIRETIKVNERVDIDALRATSSNAVSEIATLTEALPEWTETFRGRSTDTLTNNINAIANLLVDLRNIAVFNASDLTLSLTPTEYELKVTTVAKLTEQYNYDRFGISNLNTLKANILNQDTVECPKCETSFKSGDHQLESMDKDVLKLELNMGKIKNDMDAGNVIINTYQEAHSARVAILDNIRAKLGADLTDVVERCFNSTLTINDIFLSLNTLASGFDTLLKISIFTTAQVSADKQISVWELTKKSYEVLEIPDEVPDHESVFVDFANEAQPHRLKADSAKYALSKHDAVLKTLTDLEACMVNYQSAQVKYHATVMDYFKQEMIDHSNIELAKVTYDINQSMINTGLVDKLTTLVTKYKSTLTSALLLEKLLSPKTGIIGKQITGYTNQFAHQITEVINSLWGYKLEVLPCDVNKGMTYKFPIRIEDDEDVISDIAKGSTATKSIINLAILLTTRHALGLNNIPLVLDEAGTGLDTVHSEALGEYLHKLVSGMNSTNVFMVHHDAHIRGMLGSHDTIVYDKRNILLPDDYNEHVEITYY